MELNEKLARWAGVKPFPIYPTGYDYPDFTSSLDACFRWLVPRGYICGVVFRFYPGLLHCVITAQDEGGFTDYEVDIPNEPPYKEYNIDKSALALCKAIEQLIDKEQQ